MRLKFDSRVYLFEFKVVELVKEENSALEQIKNKKYYEKYLECKEIYLVGVEFSKDDKNITGYQWEKYK